MSKRLLNVLFVTWDGPQASYLESLFLPVFARLTDAGFRFHVLQFTWGDGLHSGRNRAACEAAGVTYQVVKVWRRPKALGALLSAVVSGRDVRKAIKKLSIDIVMPRSTMPALSVLLGAARCGKPILFDADGLPLDERVEFSGQNPSSIANRVLRDVEAQMVRQADGVLVRSRHAVGVLLARAGAGTQDEKFTVVTNGRDSQVFLPMSQASRDEMRRNLGIDATAPLLVYVGSIGPKYQLPYMLDFFEAVLQRRDDARFLVLTNSPNEVVFELDKRGELRTFVQVKRASPSEVPTYLGCADLGVALIQQTFSMRAAAPIKLGEYLLCGVPVVSTAGIGDNSGLLNGCGFSIDRLAPYELERAAHWFVDEVLTDREGFRSRCRELGVARFSLEACVDSYSDALRALGTAA